MQQAHVELLIDGAEEGLLSVALNAGEFGLQWHSVPLGGLRAMREFLSSATCSAQALHVGEIFGVPLYLVMRENVFSFKSLASDSSSDLFRCDLPRDLADQLAIALGDAIEVWED